MAHKIGVILVKAGIYDAKDEDDAIQKAMDALRKDHLSIPQYRSVNIVVIPEEELSA